MARKQERLPGTEQPLNEEIVKAAENYRDLRDERMELTKRESAAHLTLLEVLRKNDVEQYNFDNLKVYIVHGKDKVRVRSIDSDEDEEEDQE